MRFLINPNITKVNYKSSKEINMQNQDILEKGEEYCCPHGNTTNDCLMCHIPLKDTKPHDCENNIENNMTPSHCKICGKSLDTETIKGWEERFDYIFEHPIKNYPITFRSVKGFIKSLLHSQFSNLQKEVEAIVDSNGFINSNEFLSIITNYKK